MHELRVARQRRADAVDAVTHDERDCIAVAQEADQR